MDKNDPLNLLKILQEVKEQAYDDRRAYGGFNSGHEGYAVILEEVEELWDEIKSKDKNKDKMKKEAIQAAASLVNFIYDICKEEE